MLLGLGDLEQERTHRALTDLLTGLDCDLTVLRTVAGFRIEEIARLVVPMRPGCEHDALRARLLGSLKRQCQAQVTYLTVLPMSAGDNELETVQRALSRLADDEVQGGQQAVACRGSDIPAEIIARAGGQALVLLTLRRPRQHRRAFGELARELARRSRSGLLLIGRR